MFEELISRRLSEYAAANGIDPENVTPDDEAKLAKAAHEAVNDLLSPSVIDVIVGSLYKNAPGMLRKRRAEYAGFERRNLKRWRKAFDLIEMIWVICEESGSTYNDSYRPAAAANYDIEFEALTNLHARGLLVASEAIHLMKGGYADGALSRWRTLHEVNVVALFVAKHGADVAERYLVSFPFHSRRAMRQYKEYEARAKLDSFSSEEIEHVEQLTRELADKYGPEISNEYGWASKALFKNDPNLFDLERDIGVDHLRPYFRWASQHTHAGPRPRDKLLGVSEATQDLMLVGPSNAGMTDPLQLVSLSLIQLTNALLAHGQPTYERLIAMRALAALNDEVFDTAWSLEKKTLAEARAGPHDNWMNVLRRRWRRGNEKAE